MRRREVIFALTVLTAFPPSVRAPQPGKIPRIGYLGGASLIQSRNVLDAFQRRLIELGHVEGRSFAIEYRFADGEHDRLPELAAELVAAKVDLLVAAPAPAVVAAKEATKIIPIVMIAAPDPVALGWMDSLTRPSGNLTGLTFTVGVETFAKELELLREVTSNVRLVAVLFNPTSNPAQPLVIDQIEAASKTLGLKLLLVQAEGPDEFENAFAIMNKE